MVNESRASLKERLQSQGDWVAYLQLRDKLKGEGMPPAQAREDAAAWFPPAGQAKPNADADHIADTGEKVAPNVVPFIESEAEAEDSAADCPDADAKLASDIAEVASLVAERLAIEQTIQTVPDAVMGGEFDEASLWDFTNTSDSDVIAWVFRNIAAIEKYQAAYREARPNELREGDLTDEQVLNWIFLAIENMNSVQQLFMEERDATLAAVGD